MSQRKNDNTDKVYGIGAKLLQKMGHKQVRLSINIYLYIIFYREKD
jgi:hypothetical protein